jgi:enterochelin esterase-like enzyme
MLIAAGTLAVSAPGTARPGTLESLRIGGGHGIAPRQVQVWLPPGFNRNTRYAVLYMHDAQNLFDTASSGFGVEWQVDEALQH